MTLDREIEIGLWNCMQIMIAQIATENLHFLLKSVQKNYKKVPPNVLFKRHLMDRLYNFDISNIKLHGILAISIQDIGEIYNLGMI